MDKKLTRQVLNMHKKKGRSYNTKQKYKDITGLLRADFPGISWRTVEKIVSRDKRKKKIYACTIASFLSLAAAGWLWYPKDGYLKNTISSIIHTSPTTEEISRIKGVGYIFDSSSQKRPNVIIIGIKHPSYIQTVNTVKDNSVIDNASTICSELYDNFNVRSIMGEGLRMPNKHSYDKNKNINFNSKSSLSDIIEFEEKYSNIFNSKEWNLFIGEDDALINEAFRIEKPILKIHKDYRESVDEKIYSVIRKYFEPTDDGWRIRQEDEKKFINELENSIDELAALYSEKIDIILTDETKEKLFGMRVKKRNQDYAQQIRNCIENGQGPIIYLLGTGDIYDMVENLEGLSYAVVVPKGLNMAKKAPTLDDFSKIYEIPKDINISISKDFVMHVLESDRYRH